MFGTIRKHSKWLWAIIITVIIISFVYFFSPDARLHRQGGQGHVGMINGRAVSSAEYLEALTDAKFRFFFRYGTFPDSEDAMARGNFEPETEANARLLMLEKLREYHINVGLESTLALRDELLNMVFGGRAPSTKEALATFNEKILLKNRLTLADFERFVRHEVGINHLISLAGVSGRLVIPKEAEQIYRRENEEVVAELLYFSASNYLATITEVTPAEIGTMYTNRRAFYDVPERLQMAYVRFDASNFFPQVEAQWAKITNFNERIDAIYAQQGTNFFKDKNDQVLSPEAAKIKIKDNIRLGEAQKLAYKTAYEYLRGFNDEKTNLLSDFEVLAKASNMTVRVTAPFNEADGPTDIKVADDFTKTAFRMTPAEPVLLTPVPGEDGAYLFALKNRLPRETPPLEAVKDKVIADCKLEKAAAKTKTASAMCYSTLTNGLAQKRPFTEVCLEAKQTPIILPPFSRSTSTISNLPPSVPFNQVKYIAFNLAPGGLSTLTPVQDGQVLVFLRNRFPVDESKLKTELPNFISTLKMMRQGEAANSWFNRQQQGLQADLPKPRERNFNAPGKSGKS